MLTSFFVLFFVVSVTNLLPFCEPNYTPDPQEVAGRRLHPLLVPQVESGAPSKLRLPPVLTRDFLVFLFSKTRRRKINFELFSRVCERQAYHVHYFGVQEILGTQALACLVFNGNNVFCCFIEPIRRKTQKHGRFIE